MSATTTALERLPKTSDSSLWTDDEKVVVEAAGLVFKHTYGSREGEKELAPRPIVEKFFHTVARTGLDPLTNQIYCIGRLSGSEVVWSTQTGIDGFRLIAERSQKYAGQDAPEWLTVKGEWVDVFIKDLHGPHPAAARVAVYRHDWTKPAVGIATWDEYCQTKRNGEPTSMWATRGPGQLAKCAEALALRKAFPHDLSGIYSAEEMQQAENIVQEDAPRGGSVGGSPSAESQGATATASAPYTEAEMAGWMQWKQAIDACRDKRELAGLYQEAKPMLNRPIPGDTAGRSVGDYFMHVAATLPEEADEATGEVSNDANPDAPQGGDKPVEDAWAPKDAPAAEPTAEPAAAATDGEPVVVWETRQPPADDPTAGEAANLTEGTPSVPPITKDYGDDVPF